MIREQTFASWENLRFLGGGRKWWPRWMSVRCRWLCKGWMTPAAVADLSVAGSRKPTSMITNGIMQQDQEQGERCCLNGTSCWFAKMERRSSYTPTTPTKIECYTGEPEQDHELPRTGLGGTSGPGTFKYFKNKNVQAILRFNAKLGQGKGKAKGKATGASPSTA